MNRPWLAHYDPGVPASLAPYPETSLVEILARLAREQPAHPTVLFKGATVTARELDQWSDAFAAALVSLGVKPGDRVALLLPNCPQFLIAELGAWKAGAIVVPLNPIYKEAELEGPLRTTGTTIAVVLTPFYERVKRVQAATAVRRVITTGIKEHLPWGLRLLFTLFKEGPAGHRITRRDGDVGLADLLREHAGARPASQARPEGPALILMSGGTTGTPKGVLTLHRSIVATGVQAHAWIRGVIQDGIDSIVLPLPLFHAAGGVLGLSTLLQARLPVALVPDPRDLGDLVATIRRVRPAFFAGVPTLFNALLNHPAVRTGNPFRPVKLCFCGAAPLLAETRKRFEELTGGRIVEVYSLTEATVAMIGNPVLGVNKPGSVGMPSPDVDVRILDVDDGETERPLGEVGEIVLRAPQVMVGYWENPEETANALRRHGEGPPWLHTGDLGYLDPDGYIFIVDRMKDLMKPGGMQVWPREVEEALAAHPAVAEVGVAGVPDPARGEIVKAWVVLLAGRTVTVDELRAWCKERLAPYKVPAQIEFRRDLPKTLVGKTLRRALVQQDREARAAQGAAGTP